MMSLSLAEMLELLVPILETMASEAASLGLEVNWQKTKVQALGCREDMPLTIKVQGHDVPEMTTTKYVRQETKNTCQWLISVPKISVNGQF